MANKEEQAYLDLMKEILENGNKKEDRTGVGTLSLFPTRLDFDLNGGTIPLLTTKKMYDKAIIEELTFFIRGDTNTKNLEQKGVKIWMGNSSKHFLARRGLTEYPEGLIGPMYGYAWRNYGGSYSVNNPHPNGGYGLKDGVYYNKDGIDQLKNCFNLIRKDPDSRRIMITAYNPKVSKDCVLDPCHLFIQFYVNDGKLSCQFMMRSVDYFLGCPYNFASYAILTHIMAKATGLKANKLTFVGGDTHLYLNHLEQAKEQLSREPYDFPKLEILRDIHSVEDMEQLTYEDFKIVGYKSHPVIKAPMAI